MRDDAEKPVTMPVSSKWFREFKASWSAASSSDGFEDELSSELAALRSNGSPDAIKEGKRARAPITATSRPAGRQFMWGQRPAVAPVRITVRSMWTD